MGSPCPDLSLGEEPMEEEDAGMSEDGWAEGEGDDPAWPEHLGEEEHQPDQGAQWPVEGQADEAWQPEPEQTWSRDNGLEEWPPLPSRQDDLAAMEGEAQAAVNGAHLEQQALEQSWPDWEVDPTKQAATDCGDDGPQMEQQALDQSWPEDKPAHSEQWQLAEAEQQELNGDWSDAQALWAEDKLLDEGCEGGLAAHEEVLEDAHEITWPHNWTKKLVPPADGAGSEGLPEDDGKPGLSLMIDSAAAEPAQERAWWQEEWSWQDPWQGWWPSAKADSWDAWNWSWAGGSWGTWRGDWHYNEADDPKSSWGGSNAPIRPSSAASTEEGKNNAPSWPNEHQEQQLVQFWKKYVKPKASRLHLITT